MSDEEKIIKHLEMIQGVINRLGHDSFLIKGWSTAILAAGVIFIARDEIENRYLLFSFFIVVIGFWILDSYFLQQERLFREIYNDIRVQEKTDFAMEIKKHEDKSECKWMTCFCSKTLYLFYGMELVFLSAICMTLK